MRLRLRLDGRRLRPLPGAGPLSCGGARVGSHPPPGGADRSCGGGQPIGRLCFRLWHFISEDGMAVTIVCSGRRSAKAVGSALPSSNAPFRQSL
uniref:Uncharacterized protein n=1 Tax=Globodera rostochiensis TaxID=31243 RepID=A0A914GXD0_GLORO